MLGVGKILRIFCEVKIIFILRFGIGFICQNVNVIFFKSFGILEIFGVFLVVYSLLGEINVVKCKCRKVFVIRL